jgi:hypothetical protein
MSPRKTTQTLIPPSTPEIPYILESSALELYIQDQRTNAQRTIDDLKTEIDGYESAVARRNADTQSQNVRDEAEIRARRQRIEDLEITVMRCDAALAIDVSPAKKGRT